jgi:hypothetical protein
MVIIIIILHKINSGAFLGALAKLRKANLASPCLSVRPSLSMKQLGSHWTDFHEFDI